MVGWTSFVTKDGPMTPQLNKRRALFVLTRIDELLACEHQAQHERDTRFVDLGRYLYELRAGQYWRLEHLHSFDEFLERRFPDSRRKAYYLMSIHEELPKSIRRELRQVGWSKAVELARLARREGQSFDCATWLHKASSMPRERFKEEIERHLNGPEVKLSDLMYFRLYKSRIPVVEQALEVAARILGSDISRGYCLEMICADFLAGANLENGDPELLLFVMRRFARFLTPGQRQLLFQVFEAAA